MESQYQLYSSYRNCEGIPPPSLNGGLYVGQPFEANAPWANIPILPDTSYKMAFALKTANPPPGAHTHYPGTVRPGNNEPIYQDITVNSSKYNIACAKPEQPSYGHTQCGCAKCKMSKYAYL